VSVEIPTGPQFENALQKRNTSGDVENYEWKPIFYSLWWKREQFVHFKINSKNGFRFTDHEISLISQRLLMFQTAIVTQMMT